MDAKCLGNGGVSLQAGCFLSNTVGPGVSALAFGFYLHAVWPIVPSQLAAIGAAVVIIVLNVAGIRRSVRVTSIIVVISIVSLVTVAAIALPSGSR